MTDSLDALRPEVREALIDFDSWMNSHEYHEGVRPRRWFKAIRAELLRLASAESELAALKARIADGWLCGVSNDKCSGNFDAAIYCLPSRFRGMRVRLLVEE